MLAYSIFASKSCPTARKCFFASIATEQGVSEAAIRKQLKRIQKYFIDIR